MPNLQRFFSKDLIQVVCDFNTDVLLFLIEKSQQLNTTQFRVKPEEWVVTDDEDLFYAGMEHILDSLNYLEACGFLKFEVDIDKNVTVYLNDNWLRNHTIVLSVPEVEDITSKKMQDASSVDEAFKLSLGKENRKVVQFPNGREKDEK